MLSTIGPYRVDSLLGRSPYSAVYLAVDTRSQCSHGVRLYEHTAVGSSFAERLQELAKTLARIDHARVVRCHEVGECPEGHYVAVDFFPGGDVQGLLRRRGGVLELPQALAIIKDAAEALGALYGQGVHHFDLKPSSLLIDLQGRVAINGAGLSSLVAASRSNAKRYGNLSYCAPELAAEIDDVDVRADIFSLGAILFRMLSGTLLFDNPDPIALLHLVRRGQLPDLNQALPQVPESVRHFIARCCDRRREQRPATPMGVLDALEVLQSELQANQRAGAAIDALDQLSHDRQALRAALDAQQLRRLTQMIRIHDGGLLAVIRLAPGASFKRQVIDLILAEAGVRYGIDYAALSEATRPLDQVRQVIVARGDPAAPGANGRNVYGDPIPPPLTSVTIRVRDDGLEAAALVCPGRAVEAADLAEARSQANLQHGLDEQAIAQLASGRGQSQATIVIARGTAVTPPRHAGWRLQQKPQSSGEPPRARRGDRIATWQSARPGIDGCDVHGEVLLAPPPRKPLPEETIGLGVELEHDRGEAMLIAKEDGVVLQKSSGLIEVRPVLEIDGDLDGSKAPVESDAVVMVRGSVGAGAVLQSSSDIIILGDVDGGEISAGGDIAIAGMLGSEGSPITCGGEIAARAVDGRVLVAGSLRVDGALRSARVHVAGAVYAQHIVGGEIVCGGSIEADVLGDSEGTTTVARCGAHLQLSERQLVARLRWQKVNADRRLLLGKRDVLRAEQAALEQRSMRHRSASVSCAEALALMHEEIGQIEQSLALIHNESEVLRQEVFQQFDAVEEVDVVREAAHVIARHQAHGGVHASISDGDPEILRRARHRYMLSFQKAVIVDQG